jgi:hypothetical protein
MLTLEYVNSCYDRGYTGRSGISKTAESSGGLPVNTASSLIPIVGLPTTNPSTSPDLGHASPMLRLMSIILELKVHYSI